MFRTKKSILLLPLASLAIFVLAVGFAFFAAWSLNWYGGNVFLYVLWQTSPCCACSIASSTFAVVRKADRFPKLAWISVKLLFFSVILSFISMWVLAISDALSTAVTVNGCILLTIILLCFALFLVTLFVIIREAIRKTQDFHTWVIFVTQLMWIGFAFISFWLAAGIAASC